MLEGLCATWFAPFSVMSLACPLGGKERAPASRWIIAGALAGALLRRPFGGSVLWGDRGGAHAGQSDWMIGLLK